VGLRVRVADGELERVIYLEDFRCTGNFGGWLGLDPTDSLLFLRNLSTSDVYSLDLIEDSFFEFFRKAIALC
jgi:hypothetical protein